MKDMRWVCISLLWILRRLIFVGCLACLVILLVLAWLESRPPYSG